MPHKLINLGGGSSSTNQPTTVVKTLTTDLAAAAVHDIDNNVQFVPDLDIFAKMDQPGRMTVFASHDGVTFSQIDEFTVPVNEPFVFRAYRSPSLHVRVRLTNDGVAATTSLVFQVIARNLPRGPEAKSTQLVSTADVSIATATTSQVLAFNRDRRAALLRNPVANGASFRIGDANAGAARGIELSPGETIELRTTAAISAHNLGLAAQVLNVIELED